MSKNYFDPVTEGGFFRVERHGEHLYLTHEGSDVPLELSLDDARELADILDSFILDEELKDKESFNE